MRKKAPLQIRKTYQRSAQDAAPRALSLNRRVRVRILQVSVTVTQVTGVSVTCQSD